MDLASRVGRSTMEEWIADQVGAIARTVDALLARLGIATRDVDTVFLTGGSAFVPAVRRLFAARFGAERLRGGEELTTVATGLALPARGRTYGAGTALV
ncbi:MAG: Hsp70 family protein [Candidatus Binatia bacterium]